MVVLDLKLVGFVLLIAFLLSGYSILRSRTRRRSALHDTIVWNALEPLPFGLAVLDDRENPIFANAAAQRILSQLNPDAQNAIRQHHGTTTPRSGVFHQPVHIRWWHYPLDQQNALLVLADGGDQQRLVRQQQAFVGQLAHELRTPLTALIAHVEIARHGETGDALRQSSLDTIHHQMQRMSRLVRDLFELHRLEAADELTLQPTNVVLIAENAIAQLILNAEERGHILSFDADAEVPLVLAHPDRLTQVFLNLLDNAIKYCRPGDTIRVCLETHGDSVRCSVGDSGPGIAATDLPHVTERLFRGNTAVPGSGIGLALASEIIRQHRSTLEIVSVAEGLATGTTCSWSLACVKTRSVEVDQPQHGPAPLVAAEQLTP